MGPLSHTIDSLLISHVRLDLVLVLRLDTVICVVVQNVSTVRGEGRTVLRIDRPANLLIAVCRRVMDAAIVCRIMASTVVLSSRGRHIILPIVASNDLGHGNIAALDPLTLLL